MRNQVSSHFFCYPAELMIDKGFDVEILTMSRPNGENIRDEKHGNLVIHRFEKDNWAFFCLRLFSHMLRNDYSLIHLHSVQWFVDFFPWVVARIRKTPMIFTSHRHDLLEPLLESGSKLSLVRRVELRNMFMIPDSPTCVFVAFTESQANSYRKLGVRNVRVIPHGIDPAPFEVQIDAGTREKYALGKFNILCVGTIEPRKGQLLLVKSMPNILRKHPDTKLILLGRTYAEYQRKYYQDLKTLVNDMNLSKDVMFLEDVPRRDLVQLYLASSVFVLPTEAEMFGLVFLEAMASGLPVVSTDKPHIREILGNGEAGILVERTQKSIEDAITNLLDDESLRNRLGSNGKRIVEEKYLLKNVIAQYWDLYSSLLNRKRQPKDNSRC